MEANQVHTFLTEALHTAISCANSSASACAASRRSSSAAARLSGQLPSRTAGREFTAQTTRCELSFPIFGPSGAGRVERSDTHITTPNGACRCMTTEFISSFSSSRVFRQVSAGSRCSRNARGSARCLPASPPRPSLVSTRRSSARFSRTRISSATGQKSPPRHATCHDWFDNV